MSEVKKEGVVIRRQPPEREALVFEGQIDNGVEFQVIDVGTYGYYIPPASIVDFVKTEKTDGFDGILEK
jgi:hypothetical protein